MLYLDVACNDPDNGAFSGRAMQLNIGMAELEAKDFERGSAFAELDGAIRLAGKRWQIESAKEWVGNWCWNRYLLAKRDLTVRWYLTEFVTWLRARDLFHCSAATSDFCDWFNGNARIAPKDIHGLVCDLEK